LACAYPAGAADGAWSISVAASTDGGVTWKHRDALRDLFASDLEEQGAGTFAELTLIGPPGSSCARCPFR